MSISNLCQKKNTTSVTTKTSNSEITPTEYRTQQHEHQSNEYLSVVWTTEHWVFR